MTTEFSIAKQFSPTPGGRYISDGPFSGEAFREQYLVPLLRQAATSGDVVYLDFDGAAGYSTGFLEEAFGGLIRVHGFELDTLQNNLWFISQEDEYIIDEVVSFIFDADDT